MSCIIKPKKSQNNLDQKGLLPSPMPFQEQVSWSLVQTSSGSLQALKLLTFSGHSFHCLTTSMVKKIFLIFDQHFPLNLQMLLLFLSLCTMEKRLALSLPVHPVHHFLIILVALSTSPTTLCQCPYTGESKLTSNK